MDVKFTQSTDFGVTWSKPQIVNDNNDQGKPTDQFQPSVAAGPGGAVAVAFYDRRAKCPSDPSVLPKDVDRTNFCIDTTLHLQGHRVRVGRPAGGGQLSYRQIHLGSNEPGPKGRRNRADGLCKRY
jgi:hypothetical protein